MVQERGRESHDKLRLQIDQERDQFIKDEKAREEAKANNADTPAAS